MVYIQEKRQRPQNVINIFEYIEPSQQETLKAGVDLDLNWSFLVTVNVAILSFTRFVLVNFTDFLPENSQLFVCFCVREYTFRWAVFVYFN